MFPKPLRPLGGCPHPPASPMSNDLKILLRIVGEATSVLKAAGFIPRKMQPHLGQQPWGAAGGSWVSTLGLLLVWN